MSLNDSLSSALSAILNAEKIGKKECAIFPVSKIIKSVLKLMNEKGYIGSMEDVIDSKGNSIVVNLIGRINKCGAIKPRFSITTDDWSKFEKRYLPAKNFGILIISTSKGIMTNAEAKEKKIGGRLFAYCY